MSDAAWEVATPCAFYARTQVTDTPTYRYDQIWVRGGMYGEGGRLDMPHPPAVGDLIYLIDELGQHTGTHRVVERSWGYAAHGSGAWPIGRARPETGKGPSLNIIVVPDAGPFRDEDPGEDDDDD